MSKKKIINLEFFKNKIIPIYTNFYTKTYNFLNSIKESIPNTGNSYKEVLEKYKQNKKIIHKTFYILFVTICSIYFIFDNQGTLINIFIAVMSACLSLIINPIFFLILEFFFWG